MDNTKMVYTPSLPLNKRVLIIHNKCASQGITVLRGCKQFAKEQEGVSNWFKGKIRTLSALKASESIRHTVLQSS